jgi:4-hydroxymandelate oxidase
MDSTDLETLISLADYERAAAGVLADQTHGYLAGGASAEITLRDNEAAWERLAIRPRMLVGVGRRDLSVELLGRRRSHPVLVAPTAFQRLVHREGEIATARAAAATDTIMCLSALATTTPQSMAQAVPEVDRWFQLYVFTDRGVSFELIARAVEHGYEALVVTVDLPVVGVREREMRSAESASVEDVAGGAAAGTQGELTPMQFGQLVDPDLNWTDIEQLVAESPLPVLLKGILTAEDARLSVEHGVAGIIVSNHGGRQLDTVLSGADALPEVVAAVEGRIDVLVDGGIRHGTDVLKALALGASATLIGRPVISGLALAGSEGAQRVLEILLREFDTALALAGAPRATDLNPSFVATAPWTTTPPGTGLR